MFNINKFIMDTLKGMKGNYPDFQIKEYALNWYEKGKLTEENLAELEAILVYEVEQEYIENIEDNISEDNELSNEENVEEIIVEETEIE